MPSLKEIRERAKRAFKSRYWASVGLLGLISLVLNLWQLAPMPYNIIAYIAVILVGTVLTQGSLNVGLSLAKGTRLELYTAFAPFEKYGRNLGGSLWYALFIFLWALIAVPVYFVVAVIWLMSAMFNTYLNIDFYDYASVAENMTPGFIAVAVIFFAVLAVIVIIKSIQYFCARYLLLDCPRVPAANILNLSKRMMKGEKGRLFVLVLSVMWPYYVLLILSVIFSSFGTFTGILNGNYGLYSAFSTAGTVLNIAALAVSVLYYLPYSQAACGIFYYEVKARALAEGRVTYADLGEVPPIAPREQAYIELKATPHK